MRAAREGLAGHLRLAVIPTALTWASRLAAGYAARHPKVAFTILSRNSGDILAMLENFETDAGLSYLDNEPLGRVTTVPLYRERYTAAVRRRPSARRRAARSTGRSSPACGSAC